jgi:hypothetical protein
MMNDKKYEEIVACASSVILAKQQYGEKCAHRNFSIFNTAHIELFLFRAEAYLRLNKHQLCVDDANAGLELISAMLTQLDTRKDLDSIMGFKRMQATSLVIRAGGCNELGDKEGAFVDLRAAVALVQEMGLDLQYDLQANIMTVMAEMKLGCRRPHYTDAEIRALNKELQLKEYAPANRFCSNCGKHPSVVSVALKLCGGCKMVWFCGSECSRTYWPNHKVQCKNPTRKKVTLIPTSTDIQEDIAEKGFSLVRDDAGNGPASIMRDARTGQYFESLSDQDVFLVSSEDPEVAQREAMHQMRLRDEDSERGHGAFPTCFHLHRIFSPHHPLFAHLNCPLF